jgi:hypothetical protein
MDIRPVGAVLMHVDRRTDMAVAMHDIRLALFWAFTQILMVIAYRRFGTTYRSHPERPGIRKMEMGPIGCPETSLRNYHYSLRNGPE